MTSMCTRGGGLEGGLALVDDGSEGVFPTSDETAGFRDKDHDQKIDQLGNALRY